MLGGAATHFALGASFFDEVRVVGPVGDDFDEDAWRVLRTRGTITDDVEHVPGGKTFFWKGEYHDNLNSRETLETDLNVFDGFQPKLSEAAKAADVLFLANIQPDLQRGVREQCAALITGEGIFAIPAYPLHSVVDPTGAGDSFAGGFVGYVAAQRDEEISHDLLCTAMAYGTAVASFNVEAFGTERVERLSAGEVADRVADLQRMTTFSAEPVALRG